MRFCFLFVSFVCFVVPLRAEGPCVSGTAVGGKPGPYTFHVATEEPQARAVRDLLHLRDGRAAGGDCLCSVDERSAGEASVKGLDKALADHKAKDLRAWVTFLEADDQTGLDPKLVAWSKKHAVREEVPLGVL